MRRPFIAGNWKMQKTSGEAKELVSALKGELAGVKDVDVAVAPPFTALDAVCGELKGSNIAVASQNMHHEAKGAFTGEISASMLLDLGVEYVIIGHSERRELFGETDESVSLKVRSALDAGLKPIVCVGEKLEHREGGKTMDIVGSQVRNGLGGLSESDAEKLVVAYEPVWAIGTGVTASPEQAQEVHKAIRGIISDMFGKAVADGLRIQYGGSVKPSNALELMQKPDIDGALVGGASLDAESFANIVKSTEKA